MSRSLPNRGMFFYAVVAVLFAGGLAASGQQSSPRYDAQFLQSLKARVFQAETSFEFVRYVPKDNGSPCVTYDHGYATVFRFQGAVYEVAFYCDTPGMYVVANGMQYADRDLDGRIDLVLRGSEAVFYDYPLVTPVTIAVERRAEFQRTYDQVLRALERVLPSGV